jgi:site-specific recombinase XerD
VPLSLAALSINVVTDREVTRALVALTKDGLAEASVRRFRASLSSFFAWAVRERLIVANPVLLTRVPRSGGIRAEMFPLSEKELEEIHAAAADRDPLGRDPSRRRLDRPAVVPAAGHSGPGLHRGAHADTRRPTR